MNFILNNSCLEVAKRDLKSAKNWLLISLFEANANNPSQLTMTEQQKLCHRSIRWWANEGVFISYVFFSELKVFTTNVRLNIKDTSWEQKWCQPTRRIEKYVGNNEKFMTPEQWVGIFKAISSCIVAVTGKREKEEKSYNQKKISRWFVASIQWKR